MAGADATRFPGGRPQTGARLSDLAADSRVHRIAIGLAREQRTAIDCDRPGRSRFDRLLCRRAAAIIRRLYGA